MKRMVFAVGAAVSFYTMCAYWGAIENGRAGTGTVAAGILALAAMLCGLGCVVFALAPGPGRKEEDDEP